MDWGKKSKVEEMAVLCQISQKGTAERVNFTEVKKLFLKIAGERGKRMGYGSRKPGFHRLSLLLVASLGYFTESSNQKAPPNYVEANKQSKARQFLGGF